MRIVRFSPGPDAGLGTDPLFGILDEDNLITIIDGDPIYQGIVKTAARIELTKVRLLAPVIPRSKVVAIGKNYADHAAEMGSVVPDEPIIFLKANTTIIGPGDTIVWPEMAPTIDYEAELAIVIGRICKDGQWTRAKGFDTFCPLGPWIETEFVPGTQRITATLNGEIKQDAHLNDMIFKVPDIINFVSQVMTLLPGDVIITGTPAGIGPMPAKSTIAVSIEGLGQLTNRVSAQP
jgi:2-keto-4-pentenoate hydratase/2-oxohepta-3-ene-1,7-dioic acid hydratase in catechol pathway